MQGRCRAHECWRRRWCCWIRRLRRRRRPREPAVPVVAAVLPVPVGPVPVPHEPQLPVPVPGAAAARLGAAGPARCRQTSCSPVAHCPRRWSNQRYPCTFRAASRSQPQWQGVHRQRGNQRTSRHRVQGDHRKAIREHQREGAGCRLVGDVRAAGIHHGSLGYGSRTAWMRCARPAPPRTYKDKVALWVKLVSTGDSLAAALVRALVPETACRSAGKLNPVFEQEPPA